MVKVIGTRGNTVSVEVKGINTTLAFLARKNKLVFTNAEIGLLRAGNFVQQEVQESIIGRRAEPKSVDTGKFANSITLRPVGKGLKGVVIFPKNVPYANALEFGTSRINPRRHFNNTKDRTKHKVKEELKNSL